MLDPLQDDGCQPDPDPRLSEAERLKLIGVQYSTSRYVLSIDERVGHEKVELWAGPHKLTDQHARRILAAAMRQMMP